MAGYTRNDTSNNIATGNVINAADLDGEFDALVAAFHASTGHTHDGTAANGAPITKIGPAQDLVISTGAITPKTDNTVDLGSSSFEFKDLYIDGTANIDALVADTADINAGTIDGVTLGTNSAVTEAQIDNININGNTISSTDTNGNISLVPNGTGDVILTADTIQVGDSNTDVTVTTNGTGDLIFNTNAGTNSGVIRIYDGANGNIALTPNGTGEVDISKVDIDSGAIDGTAIGANSASTGAFTTLSASSTVTLSGGTADGVLYLNGSKVATSGSALTFDGTTLNNSGAFGTSTAALTLKNSTAPSSSNIVEQQFFAANSFSGLDTIAKFGALNPSAGANNYGAFYWSLAYAGAPSEQMRLTSTGLGIGTSSPNYKLNVIGTNGGTTGLFQVGISAVTNGFTINTDASNNIVYSFLTKTGSTGIYQDASGGVGIGTSSPGAKLDVSSGATTFGAKISTSGTNTYTPTGSTSLAAANLQIFGGNTSGACTGMRISQSGSFELFFGAVQEAGGAGAFVWQGYSGSAYAERMRLDSSGNLGLGVTPSGWNTYKALQVTNASLWGAVNNAYVGANYYYASGSRYYIANGYATEYSQASGVHSWNIAASGTAGNAITFTQAMTLDASGDWVVGGTTPDVFGTGFERNATVVGSGTTAAFNISGASASRVQLGVGSTRYGLIYQDASNYMQIGTTTSLPIIFSTNNTERARITSGGDLLVGTTSAVHDTITNGFVVVGTSAVTAIGIGHVTGSGSGTNYASFNYNGASIGSISQNGTTAVAYNTSSDYRLKDNPQPLTNSGAFIDALKPKTWEWKTDGSRGVGFIAHEVQEVSPGSVVGEKDGEQMQAMEYGSAEFIANIIAELQSLRQRVALLEGN